MRTIDSDAHVIENESTWEYVLESERQFRPQIVTATAGGASVDYWLVDGKVRPWTNIGKDTPKAAREMSDLSIRIKHMDELNVDIQVIYPTFFIFPYTQRPEIELALSRSYNRWMAEIVKRAPDRFRWIVVVPLLSMDRVFEELRFGKENGACGIFLRGLEGERRLTDPYFFPLYEEASRLDMPVCVHSANGSMTVHDFFIDESGFCKFKLAVVGAFHSLVFDGIPERFPKLRIGIIEVSAQWVPYAVHDLVRRMGKKGRQLDKQVLRDKRIYVACQTDDDLPYILEYAGEDNLVIGSDYGHADSAAEIEALRRIKHEGNVTPRVINKILNDNARALYGM
ncbi:MAG TPA: amidohydrolase family protein [Candidatus Binatia bacterium]|jgi:predicted TIM-barrel fold metal-dependent hydrolase|nr:amidohydrolase family protein [Candidatus Binatia bacterium]